MIIFILSLTLYFLILMVLGWYAHKKTKRTPEDYFLASRSFGPMVLFFTLIATNFSAFTFLGFAGKAYKSGFGQYGIMGFGTAMMAIMFYVVGRKVWLLGKKRGYITPPELIGDRFQSVFLKWLFLAVMVIFTIPYLATQAIGAGYIIKTVLPDISLEIGAVATIIVITVYIFLGGMRGSSWTDVLQGLIMIVALILAAVFVTMGLGGFENANHLAYNANPSLFSRPGADNFFTPQIWFSFMLLWLFCDPMFPQIFSRFYTAKDQRSLKYSMIFYPIVVSILFFIPVLMGVWANGVNLQISSGSEDMVLPLMVAKFAPTWVFGFVMIGALAALMSTADSQLFSLSTMLSRDIFSKKYKSDVIMGKIFIIVLSAFAIVFILFGYNPHEGIMGTLVKTTFSGLVVLAPTTISALYWKRATKYGCIASILAGELSIFLLEINILPTFGFLPAIIALLISSIVLIVVSYITPPQSKSFLDKYFIS